MKLKSPAQIERIRASGQILAHTLRRLTEMIRPGVSLLDLDHACREMLSEYGASPAFLGYNGFAGALCLSVNEEVIHGIPSPRKLEPGDVLSIDCGVNYEGYISDSATTVAVPPVAAEIEQLLRVTREALDLGIEAARIGNRVHDISRAIYDHVTAYDYGVVRPFCGHGVGFDVHEEPQIPNYVSRGPNPRLKAGMVIAIEPMINLGGDEVYVLDDEWTVVTADSSISAHFEHTIAIREDGPDRLTELQLQTAGKESYEGNRR